MDPIMPPLLTCVFLQVAIFLISWMAAYGYKKIALSGTTGEDTRKYAVHKAISLEMGGRYRIPFRSGIIFLQIFPIFMGYMVYSRDNPTVEGMWQGATLIAINLVVCFFLWFISGGIIEKHREELASYLDENGNAI